MYGLQLHYIFPGQVSVSEFKGTSGYLLIINKSNFELINFSLRFGITIYKTKPVVEISNEQYEMLRYEFVDIKAELLVTDPILLEIIGLVLELFFRKGAELFKNNWHILKYIK